MKEPEISNNQMIVESYVMMKTLKERVDQHSMKHDAMFDKIWTELKEQRIESQNRSEKQDERITTQNERITKVETERNLSVKIMTPIISAAVACLTSVISRKF